MTVTITQSIRREFTRCKGHTLCAISRLNKMKTLVSEDEYSEYRDKIDMVIQSHKQAISQVAELELDYMTNNITNVEGN